MRSKTICFVAILCLLPLITNAAEAPKHPPAHLSPNGDCALASAFAADTPDESTDVLTCGAPLRVSQDGGSLTLDIPIARVVGDDPLLASQAGFLGANATIKIAAQHCPDQVDFGEQHLPMDAVSVNGHAVGYLQTGNAALDPALPTCTGWTLTNLQIPVQDLIFPINTDPSSAPVPATNQIRIDVDTLRTSSDLTGWNTSVDWASISFTPARPVLLVHGILSSGKTWWPLWFTQLSNAHVPFGWVNLPGGVPGVGGTFSIQTNAAVIADTVATMKRQFGASKINIVAHSKGGLDSREYVEFNKDVDQLIQIGSPNAGSPLADYIYDITSHISILQWLINHFAPIEYVLTTKYMKEYDQIHGHNPDVRYTAIAGYWHPGWFDFSKDHLLAIIVGRGDTIVPRWSVKYLEYTHDIEFDSFGNDGDAKHTHLTSSQPIYFLVAPMLGIKPAWLILPSPTDGSFDDSHENPVGNHTHTIGGHVKLGDTVVQTVAVDESKPISFSMIFKSTDQVSLAVVSPSGTRYDAGTVYPSGAGYAVSEFAGQPMVTIHFDQPEVGTWSVLVKAEALGVNPDGGSDGYSAPGPTVVAASNMGAAQAAPSKPHATDDSLETEYLLDTWISEPSRTMTVVLDKEDVHVGDSFRVKATLTNAGTPMTGVPVTGEAAVPGGTVIPLQFHDDGVNGDLAANDGIYTADLPATLGGAYDFQVNADENRPGAVAFSRQANVVGGASTSYTHVEGGFTDTAYSSTGTGLWDTLAVSASLNVDSPGTFRILGILTDAAGNTVATAPKSVDATAAASIPIVLNFPGSAINTSRTNGPYHFGVRVAQEIGQAIVITQDDANLYTTAPYMYYQFVPAPSSARTPLNIAVTGATAPYGGTTSVSATVTALGLPVEGKTITFAVDALPLGTATTDANGVAALQDVPVPQYAVPGAHTLQAIYNGDQVFAAATGKAAFYLTEGVQSIAWATPADIVPGTPLGSDQLNAVVHVTGYTPAGDLTYDPPADTVLPLGDGQTLTVTAADTGFYAAATATVKINVRYPSATITWNNPADIAYGTPLSSTQLDAVASMPGTFTYSPAAGTVLNAGASQTLTVTFAPTNSAYPPVTKSVSINVAKGAQTIQWAKPAGIAYGTPLSSTQLDATVTAGGPSAAGALSYAPAAGTVLNAGTQTLTVTAAETQNYAAATATVTIDVAKAVPTVTWSNPAGIAYGTPLSSAQLNAAASVAGTFTYSPAAGTILNAGTQTLSVLFTPSDANYTTQNASVTINVAKAAPVITWTAPAPIVYGTPLSVAQLNASANVAGSFTYTPAAGTILHAGAAQTLSVQFTPSDTADYQSATATAAIDVVKAPQSITWSAPAAIVYGTPLSATQLDATVSVVGPSPAGALTYAPAAGTVLQAGTAQTLSVSAAATQDYDAATATVAIDVLKAKPTLTWATPSPIVYGTPLDTTQLDATANIAGSFAYAPPAGTVLDAGTQLLAAHFTPTDTRNYEEGDVTTSLVVRKATPVLTWAAPSPIVYGTPLSGVQLNATANVAGTFAYTPAAGTVLNAGSGQTLSVQFTPTDTRNYNGTSATATIDVTKAKQTLSWSAPAAIVYGTPLTAAQLDASVSVVGPAPAGALGYAPAAGTVLDAGIRTLTVTAAETANYFSATASVTLTVNRAPLVLVVDAKSKLYGAPVPPLTGTLIVVNGDAITPAYATTATQQSATGSYPITATLVDPSNRLANYAVTITPSTLTVLPAPLQIAANPATKQYSDPLPQFTATFTGFVLGDTPAVLGGTLSITTGATALSAPGAYSIAIGGLTSSNYAIVYVGSTLTVTQEDARVAVVSPLTWSGNSVTLVATVKDISATPDANGDDAPGDIRKATLTFVDRATNAALCTAPITLVSPDDLRIGIATCNFTPSSNSIDAGSVVGGYYFRDAAADDVTVTIVPPTTDRITGGGSLALDRSDSFNINFQYDKKGIVNGSFAYTWQQKVDGVSHTFRISADAIGSLTIARTKNGGTAAAFGTATLTDVTAPDAPVVIDSNVPLIVTATDAGEPGTADSLSILLLKSTGGFSLATGWDGTRAVEQTLTGGNLVVHYGK